MRPRRRRGRNRGGQVIVMFAIAFALFTFGLIVMVANLATIYSRQADAARAAQDGAQAGSADVDLKTFLTGSPVVCTAGSCHGPLRLNSPGAKNLCLSTVASELNGVTYTPACTLVDCNPAGDCQGIQATVKITVPYTLGFGSVTVTQTYTAAAQPGTITPVK